MPGLWVWGSSKLRLFSSFFSQTRDTAELRLLQSLRQTDTQIGACSFSLSVSMRFAKSELDAKGVQKWSLLSVSFACNTMATEGKCDHEISSSSWQTQKHSPSRTWSKQTHLPSEWVELIDVPCSGFITHFNALPYFFSLFWQLNVILQSRLWGDILPWIVIWARILIWHN